MNCLWSMLFTEIYVSVLKVAVLCLHKKLSIALDVRQLKVVLWTGSASSDQGSSVQLGQLQTNATSHEYSDQITPEAFTLQTNASDEESTMSSVTATCTRTRTVKTPKYYDS